MERVRVDKWLWAARFFKTRTLAKQAIEGGKVRCDGQRVKASRELMVGMQLTVRQGWDERVITVNALSDQRRGASEAALLYQETAESIAQREAEAERRKAMRIAEPTPPRRPTKKQRRQIHRFKSEQC